MMSIAGIPASNTLLAQLANPAARALALSVAVGIGLAVFRVKTTALRLFTWTAVLYAALAMPLLGWLLPPLPIPSPGFLQNAFSQTEPASQRMRVTNAFAHPSAPSDYTEQAKPPLARDTGLARARAATPALSAAPAQSPSSAVSWSVVASAIYLAVASLLLVRFFVGLVLGHRLAQNSKRIDEPPLRVCLATRANAAGLPSSPRVAESELISVPLTMGAFRPTILLPSNWRAWDEAKLDAVLAHEVSHVARRDALTQRLSLLHRAIFWFSPPRMVAEPASRRSRRTGQRRGRPRLRRRP